MNPLQKYNFACTLTFGDIYGQVIIWLIVIFLGLASAVAMYENPLHAFLVGGLILVLSLPFLLFAFVTTLLNHIELRPVEANATNTNQAPGTPARATTGAMQAS